MSIYQDAGKQLETLRGRKTQEEFAELLNLSQSQYAKIEKGINRVQLQHLFELAKEYNLTIILTADGIKISQTISSI